MKRRLIWTTLMALAGCEAAPSRVEQDRPDPRASSLALELFDADKSGALEAEELKQLPGLGSSVDALDADKNAALSSAEIQTRLNQWVASKSGRITVSIIVTRDGKPAPGLDVKLIPEAFLKGTIVPAVGTTDERGIALPTQPESDDKPRGVGPGFYRVEVSGGTPPVAAKFNTATTLGLEVAPDSPALLGGAVKFDIGK